MATSVAPKYVSSAPGLRTYVAQLEGSADLSSLAAMPRGAERKVAAQQALTQVHEAAMTRARPQLDAMREQGLLTSYQELALGNMLVLDVPEERAAEAWTVLNSIPGMGRILRNREIPAVQPVADAERGASLLPTTGTPAARADQWNVAKIGADKVWAAGVTGEGITIGIIDTGVAVEHEALKPHYRGTQDDGSMVDDYNWFDAYGKSATPVDLHGHGTHVTGTAAGGIEGESIGIAPGAKWIAARMMADQGGELVTTIDAAAKALEWMLAPTDASGANADASKAPDLISNSWSIGAGTNRTYERYWKAFNAAGIPIFVAAGNDGKNGTPGTVTAPGSYLGGITVGSTDVRDKVAGSSGRGPSPLPDPGDNTMKPDIAAPGVSIRSSVKSGGYGNMSGTSMATPAAAGVAALLLSKFPELTQDELLAAMQSTAVDIDEPGADMASGAGRIDAEAALAAAGGLIAAREGAALTTPVAR